MSDTTVLALLGRLRALDVRLRLEDGALRFAAPPGAMTDALRDELRAHRDALVAVLARDAAATAPIPRRAPGMDVAPLSFGQRRLWFLERAGSGGAAYNIAVAARLAGVPDAAALADALSALVARHEVLRSGVVADGPEPLQRVHAAAPVPLPVHDLRGTDASARVAALEAALDAEARRPFDLAAPPLLRAVLHVLAADASVLQLTVHHAAADGWSLRVLAAELSALYAARVRGEAAPLAPLPLQYGDFASWERQRFGVSTAHPALDATRTRLAGVPPLLDLPGDRPRPAATGGDAGAATRPFPPGLPARVAAAAARLGTTPFVVQLAALQALLASLTGQDDVVVGSPVANRTRTALEPLVGFFVNTLVLRARLAGDPSFEALVRATHADALAAQEAGELPVDRVVELLAPRRAVAHHPLFQVLLTVQGGDVPSLALAPFPPVPLETRFVAAKFDLALYVEERAGAATVTATWPRALLDDATAQALLDAWLALLARAVDAPATPLSRLGDDWATAPGTGTPAGATLDDATFAGAVATHDGERDAHDGRATLRPLAGERLTVVDARGGVVPPGGVGTLAVIAPRTGDVPRRTGWRARRRADGTIALVGATARLATVAGYAVHLDDVRRALAALDGVDDVAVLVAPDGGLAAFVATARDAAALRAALAAQVAEHLVPAHLVVRAGWAPSRERAPALLATLADAAGAGDAAGPVDGALEGAIAAAWREVLQRPHVAPTENFFDAGGHSLLLLALHARIAAATGRDFPVVDLFRFPTIRALAAHLAGGATAVAAPAATRDDAQARAERQRAALVRQRARMAAAGLRPLDPTAP